MLKLFKVKVIEYLDEQNNGIYKTEYIAAETMQDIYNGKLNGELLEIKPLIPFKVIE
jgi:hypothetical protein